MAGSRGRRGLARLVYGSVASRLARYARVPALIVKGQRPAVRRVLACTGGEDYELVFVAPGETLEALRPEVTMIGEMVEDGERRARLVDASGVEIRLPAAGWDHLRT